jgi:hypothetical protein
MLLHLLLQPRYKMPYWHALKGLAAIAAITTTGYFVFFFSPQTNRCNRRLYKP